MDYKEPEYHHYRLSRLANSLAFAAFFAAMFRTIIFPYILAPLSILFAVLSKGKLKKSLLGSKIAIWISCFTLIFNTAFCGYSYYILTTPSKYREQVDQMFEQVYGETFDEYLEELQLTNTPFYLGDK